MHEMFCNFHLIRKIANNKRLKCVSRDSFIGECMRMEKEDVVVKNIWEGRMRKDCLYDDLARKWLGDGNFGSKGIGMRLVSKKCIF